MHMDTQTRHPAAVRRRSNRPDIGTVAPRHDIGTRQIISRADLESLIEAAIAYLDHLDGNPDLEETGDDEPSLGHYTGSANQIDLELDDAENEPSLGSLEQLDQRLWSCGSGDDGELDESDHEHSGGGASGDDDPIFGHLPPPSAFIGSAVQP